MDHDEGNGQVPREIRVSIRRRGRDLAALVGIGGALAVLWAVTFSFSVQDWGEYRPAGLDFQAPPPAPTIIIPRLTLREAQDLIGLHGDRGEASHDPR